ncbi:aminotransferase class V-fold PLP-dependent enzyme [Egbenema bharatensis]|uniref:aminotransferase class V-fold PLP-dependent enzyme n=1 Tax=Egbenema bharatensis TaxID=3463334 RepID=UPI003A87E2C1
MADSSHSVPEPLSSAGSPDHLRSLWALDPTVAYLNHGSFGACPIAVLEQQQLFRSQLEAEPVRFFETQLEPLLDDSRSVLAQLIGADTANLAFVPNATTGVNTVLRSLTFQPGDELLTTNHEYNASRNALDFVAQRSGATVVVAQVPFPIASSEQAITAILDRVSPRTQLVLVDHVTSQTALVFPLKSLVKELADRGIDVLVDGAHAPGMIPLQLKELGAAYYTGNCHKWLCAPKGAAFLYVREDKQPQLRPLVISHGANSPRRDRSLFHLEFDWTGTFDPTAYLCVATAIRLMGSLFPDGWTGLMDHNRAVILSARQRLSQALGISLPCPAEMIGSMATLPLPRGSAKSLQDQLFRQFQIEVPIFPWSKEPDRAIRVSAQVYNTATEYDQLAEALRDLLSIEAKDI